MKTSREQLWKCSRSGAQSGKGYRYQDHFIALLLIKQWAGQIPNGSVIPEGFEDVVLDFENREIWIQIKSRKSNSFSLNEVESYRKNAEEKLKTLNENKVFEIGIGLQKPCSKITPCPLEELLNSSGEQVVVSESPNNEAVEILIQTLKIADSVAEALFKSLSAFVGEVSDANETTDFHKRIQISPTDIEWLILKFLEGMDSSAIDIALLKGAIEPIDFNSPIEDQAFYSGVKTQPGHIAAGLIIDRPQQVEAIYQQFKTARQILVTGPSGAGKSSLIWLTANKMVNTTRWFRLSAMVKAEDIKDIQRFIKARNPNQHSPIGIVCDEINPTNMAVWTVLAEEALKFPNVILLGAVRNEDLGILKGIQDAEMFPVELDSDLARSLWEELKNRGKTNWPYWKEPFEDSKGLLLEYTHILTQGKRLEKLLSEQVQQRLEDPTRTIELKILRASSLLTSLNGEIEIGVLLDILGVSPEEGFRSLSRLLKEHLVKEKSPGILGGLHNLRSSALARLTHDELVIQTEDSLLQSIRAVTTASLPLIIQAVLREPEKFNRLKLIDALVSIQKEQNTVETMTAILTGLGFASLEVRAKQFIQLLEEWNIERSLWSVTAMFAVAKGVEFPDLPSVGEGWSRLKELVQHFHSIPPEDFRITFLDKIHVFPALEGLDTLQLLLASMVNMSHFPSFDLNILDVETNNYCIRKISKVLETAYSVSPDFALSLSKSFGGEEHLLKMASEQISWIIPPIIREEEHGRTVRADYQFMPAQTSDNMNDKAVEICKIIMALVPSSEAAACSFVDTNGMVIQIEDRPMMAKNIPRHNLPTEVVVTWNKALGYFIQSNANIISLSEYSTVMSSLITRTESVFREVTEKWIRGAKFNNQEQIAEELNSIVQACNGLSFTIVPSLLGNLQNASNLGISSDTVGTLLTSILNNLIPRLCAVSQESDAQGVASFALHLSNDTQKCTNSAVWRMLDDTPADQLIAISERLEYLSEILQEFAAQYDKGSIELIVTMAKRASFGKSIVAASKFSKNRGEHRLKKTLECLLKHLKEEGIEGEYKTVPLKKNDGIYWPAVEIAIIMTISELEELNKLETVIQIAKEALDENRTFTVVPKLNGKIISRLAMKIYPNKSLPDVNFNDIWLPEFQEQVLKSKIMETFGNAMSSAYDISAICISAKNAFLREEENDALSSKVEKFIASINLLEKLLEIDKKPSHAAAGEFIVNLSTRLKIEVEGSEKGIVIEDPIAAGNHQILNGQLSSLLQEYSMVNLLLIADECHQLV